MLRFLDSNLVIYALTKGLPEDAADAAKREVAKRLLGQFAKTEEAVISAQVLSEFFVVATRRAKPPLSLRAAAEAIRYLSELQVVPIDADLVQLAVIRMHKSMTSYWDALIVEAAIRAGAAELYSEDLQHGMWFDSVRVVNPFAAQ